MPIIYTKYFHAFVTISAGIISYLAFAYSANAATLSLSPSKSSVQVGEVFSVDIVLDTEGAATDGVDIRYLNFDPTLLEVQQVVPGTLYPSTQSNYFDNTAGIINFSQITTGGSTYNGSGTLATIEFKANASGKAEVSFNFEPGSNIDTNVASGAGADILTDADGGIYKIESGVGFFSLIINFFRNLFSFSF